MHLINVTFLPSKVAGSSRPWYPITLVLIFFLSTLSPLPSPSSPSLALVAVTLAAVALALFNARHPRRRRHRRRHRRRPCPCRTHPLLHPLRRRSTTTLVIVAIAISSLALFVAALIIRRALSLFVVACRPAHVHRPTLTLPSLVDCCFFTPPADGGGRLGASSAPPIQRTRPTPPRRRSKNASRGCGVAATATAIPALASGQFWPTIIKLCLRALRSRAHAPRSRARARNHIIDIISYHTNHIVPYRTIRTK